MAYANRPPGKTGLLAIVTHDWMNLLSAISSMAELLINLN